MVIVLILLCFLTGLMIINLLTDKIKATKVLLFAFPLGIVLHTVLFSIFLFFKLYYNFPLFVCTSLLTGLSLFKRRIKIENDLRKIPIYYVIFLIIIALKLISIGTTGFFDFYNYDEFTAYTRGSIAIHYAKDYFSFFETYAPINYFIGTEVLYVSGYTISIARLFSTIFFLLTSYFIFIALTEQKVNKHMSAVIAILFVFSSTELIQLSKSFYTNIFFMFYFSASTYYITNYYFNENKSGIPIIYYLLLLGVFLTRHEAMYFSIAVFVILGLINLKKKKISKIECALTTVLPVLFLPLYKFLENSYNYKFLFSHPENLPLVERVLERLEWENFQKFIENIWLQTFDFGFYYFNWLIYAIFLLGLVLIIICIIKKDNSKEYKKEFIAISIMQLSYICIVIATEFILFTIAEYKLAASFSRYTLAVLPVSFIIVGVILFRNNKCPVGIKNTIKYKNPKCILIIPAYNEEKNILTAYNRIQEYNKTSKLKFDAIVINDCSTDNTEKVLCDNNIPHIQLIHNLGIGGGVQTGYKYAYDNGYDIAIQYDGDGQHDINYIDKLIDPICNGQASITIGSRFIEAEQEGFKSTFFRRIGIRIISIAIKLASGKKIYDTTSGYRACNREVMEYFANNYPIEYPEPITNVELLNMNYIVKEVPVVMKERKEGMSSIRAWKQAYYMINVVLSIIIVGMRGEK